MTTFALIAEGKTDQVILDRIITEICEDKFQDGVDVLYLQPLWDATDAADITFGNWEMVFLYCKEKAVDALAYNDYLVIHIDTDAGDHLNFGLNLTDQGVERPVEDLIADCKNILVGKIGNENYLKYRDKIIFAISVHSLESWLLLYFFNKDERHNCYDRLNYLLRKADKNTIKKTASDYAHIGKKIKKKELLKFSGAEHSISDFIDTLDSLDV